MSTLDVEGTDTTTAVIDIRSGAVLAPPPSRWASELARRIEDRDAVVAVIGLGYVGLPLAVAYAEAGFPVLGFDVSASRVAGLRAGRSPVEDIADDRLAPLVGPLAALYRRAERSGDGESERAGMFVATSDFDGLELADAVIICVPTPLSHTKDPDMSFIMSATDQIARRLRPGVLVVLESTTYPGTTEELVLPRLEGHGGDRSPYVVGRDFFLAFSPERIDPGRRDYTIANTPKVIGGVTPTCLSLANTLYSAIVEKTVPVSQTKAAELVKLLENTFRSVNIGLVNELALWCNKLGVDVWEVIEAAATKPFGFMKFLPGPGLGGHCIPVDPHYLAWKLRTLDHGARFIQLADEVNMGMPRHVCSLIAEALNADRKSVNGSNVLVLGVAYKPNVSDVRESPAVALIELLLQHGANVSYCDPHVTSLTACGRRLEASELTAETLHAADCVVVETDHAPFDWDLIVTHAAAIVDTRNGTARATVAPKARIVKL